MARKPVYGAAEWDRICQERQHAQHVRLLELAAQGHTDHEIAQAMNYSVWTVKKLWPPIWLRLGARNRTHAVAQAIREGIVA